MHINNPKKFIFLSMFIIGFSVGAQIEIQVEPRSDKLFGNVLNLLALKFDADIILENKSNQSIEFYLTHKIVTPTANIITWSENYKPNKSLILAANERKIIRSSDLNRMYSDLSLKNIIGIENLFGHFLPESSYTFCFEAIEVQSGVKVNTNFPCFWFTVVELKKPIITQPSSGDFLAGIDSIEIKWASGNEIKNEAFSLEIINLTDLNLDDPEIAFAKHPEAAFMLIYLTQNRSFTLDLGQFVLEKNKTYAIRLRSEDLLKRYKFKNKGYSDAVKFYF